MRLHRTLILVLLIIFTSLLTAREVNIFFLVHGLYSSNSYWSDLIESDRFEQANYYFAGNFDVDENLFRQDEYIVTPDFDQDIDSLIKNHQDLVFTINFSSGFRNSFKQQANQIGQVLKMIPDSTNYHVYLVGHSMGGLASRCYVTTNLDHDVDGLITIGTPNLGSYLGNTSSGLTGFIGRFFEALERPDNILTGLSRIWKDNDKNVTPELSPQSADLMKLNSFAFPDSIKSISIFSTINTKDEIEGLSDSERLVHQVLQVEKLKSFDSLNPKDIEITKLYNDLYYNDGIVAITSQNIQNAIPNKYDIEAHHIPTRVYHDHEPMDFNHIIPAMQIITQKHKSRNYNIFIYSTTAEVINNNDFRGLLELFHEKIDFKSTFVIDDSRGYYPIYYDKDIIYYDYGLFLVDDNEKLDMIASKIENMKEFPIIINFSEKNNISKFHGKDCIYVKVDSIDEAEKFSKFLIDMLSGKIHVKEDEIYKVKEPIIRYYFSDSNMTERLKIPSQWWKDHLMFFQ